MKCGIKLAFLVAIGALSSCAKGADVCIETHSDTAWGSIDGRDAYAELSRYSEMRPGVRSAEAVFGPHWKKEMVSGEVRYSWLRGMKRSAKTIKCNGDAVETWQVSYAIIEVVDGDLEGCSVGIKVFIGKNGSPDPDMDTPVHSSVKSCKEFLMD